jgi:ankyrin repeat protein
VLLAHGADINNSYGNSNWTPLHYAADHNSIAEARLLLTHRVNVNAKDKDGRTPMFYATQKGYSDIVQLLTQNGGND